MHPRSGSPLERLKAPRAWRKPPGQRHTGRACSSGFGRAKAHHSAPGTMAAADGDVGQERQAAAFSVTASKRAATAARPWPSVKQPTVRTDRPRAQIPSAMRPWTPRHSGLQRHKVTHGGTEKNGPPATRIAASGPFSQVVAGVGFEPT